MNLSTLLPLVSKFIGRDITPEVELFFRARSAIGKALNPEGQQFFVQNWQKMADFMESPAGQEATVDFMNAWAVSLLPKPVETPPEAKPEKPAK